MDVLQQVDAVVTEYTAPHPFAQGIGYRNIRPLLRDYLAMSQAFPYLQAGSQAQLILQAMADNRDIGWQAELTSVVGNFLSWDETGGHPVLMQQGLRGLPEILDTERHFHANLLKRDIAYLLGDPLPPRYSDATRTYLKDLLAGLSSLDHLCRLAYMVAFEQHAGLMVEALWQSLSRLFEVPRDELSYFHIHVGGKDPAEPYHIEMTRLMIAALVITEADQHTFITAFRRAYCKNLAWCESIKAFH